MGKEIPVGRAEGGGTGKCSFGRGRHSGMPVFASEGTSQYVVFGYGNLIFLVDMCSA
jgi:hypothetical protein